MDGEKMQKKIEELEQQIAELPVGYISKKKIHGKDRFYHQWTEDGKVRSKYLREGEKEPLEEQVQKRRKLQAQLKELKAKMPKARKNTKGIEIEQGSIECNVTVGRELLALSQDVDGWMIVCIMGREPGFVWSMDSGVPERRPCCGRQWRIWQKKTS